MSLKRQNVGRTVGMCLQDISRSFGKCTKKEINTMMDLSCDCIVVYFGSLPQGMKKLRRCLLLGLLAGAKLMQAITHKWLDVKPPSSMDWKEIIKEMHAMERRTFSLRLAAYKYNKYWKKWNIIGAWPQMYDQCNYIFSVDWMYSHLVLSFIIVLLLLFNCSCPTRHSVICVRGGLNFQCKYISKTAEKKK